MRCRSRWLAAVLVALASRRLGEAQLPIATRAGLLYLVEDEIVLDAQRLSGVTIQHLARVGKGHALSVVRGRVELLLQPLQFLRLAPGARVEMVSDDLADVRVKLGGTAIFDVI